MVNEAEVTERIRARQRERKLSTLALAQEAGIAQVTLNRKLVSGKGWTVSEIISLAPVLNIRPAELLSEQTA